MAVIGGGGGGIKSIQRGTTTVTANSTATATINSVDEDKSFISASCRDGAFQRHYYYFYGVSWGVSNPSIGATLTNSTTVTFSAGYTIAGSGGGVGTDTNPIMYWEVIEYE
jgi:hypothetical protein